MLGPRQAAQASLFYEFSLDDHIPQDHLLRTIFSAPLAPSIRLWNRDGHGCPAFQLTFAPYDQQPTSCNQDRSWRP